MLRKRHISEANGKWIPLLRENGYPEAALRPTAEKLERLSPGLRESLMDWEKTGKLPDTEVEGFTARELMELKGLNEIAALLMLDWLQKEPEEAKLALAEPLTGLAVDEDTVAQLERFEELDAKEQGTTRS